MGMTMANDEDTSLTLLERLQKDPASASAWDAFVRRYRPRIYGWCQTWGLQGADADDVTQQVLAKLTGAMRSFHYDPSRRFRAWLKTVTRHAWSDWVAGRRRDAGSGDSGVLEMLHTVEARADLEQRLEEAFDRELLETAMHRVRQRVEARTWEAFRLTALDGLPGAEAAAQLGMPVAHVFVAKHRVQKMLHAEIRRLEGPDPE
jgi:RNA polymerase sigma factor (sigma-70 family)